MPKSGFYSPARISWISMIVEGVNKPQNSSKNKPNPQITKSLNHQITKSLNHQIPLASPHFTAVEPFVLMEIWVILPYFRVLFLVKRLPPERQVAVQMFFLYTTGLV